MTTLAGGGDSWLYLVSSRGYILDCSHQDDTKKVAQLRRWVRKERTYPSGLNKAGWGGLL